MKKIVTYVINSNDVKSIKEFLSERYFEMMKIFIEDGFYKDLNEMYSCMQYVVSGINSINEDNFIRLVENEDFGYLGLDCMEVFMDEYEDYLINKNKLKIKGHIN